SMGHPLLGDRTYGARIDRRPSVRMPQDLIESLDGVALHAAELAFTHPVTGERLTLVSPLPHRIEGIVSHLRRTSGRSQAAASAQVRRNARAKALASCVLRSKVK